MPGRARLGDARPRRRCAAASAPGVVALAEQECRTPRASASRDVVALGRTPHLGAFAGPGDRDRAVVRALPRGRGARRTRRPRLRDALGRRAPAGQPRPRPRAGARAAAARRADEPPRHPRAARRCSALLRELAAAGSPVLAALHDLSLAAAYADHVVVLAAGRVVAAGDPRRRAHARAHPRRVGRRGARARAPDDRAAADRVLGGSDGCAWPACGRPACRRPSSPDLGNERLGHPWSDDSGIRGRIWNGAAERLDGAVLTCD